MPNPNLIDTSTLPDTYTYVTCELDNAATLESVRPEFWAEAYTDKDAVTAVMALVGDGEFLDILVTDSSRPYDAATKFERVPSRFIW